MRHNSFGVGARGEGEAAKGNGDRVLDKVRDKVGDYKHKIVRP